MEIENRGIRRLVQDGQLEEAIKNLDILFEDLMKERVVLATMQNRLAELRKDEEINQTTSADLNLQRNKITSSFLNFFLFLEEKINNVMSIKYDVKNFDEQVKLKMMQQYEVKEKLGEGVSAVLFKAIDINTQREVAIRALKSINAANINEEIKSIANAAKIKHRNIIEIISFDMDDIPYCVVMEYIHGIRLDEMLQIGPFPLRDAVKITIQLCEALYYLQNCGITKYGRVRPSKIIIDQELQPVVSVFEIFKSKGLYQDRSKMGKELLSVRDDLRYVSPEEFFTSDYHEERDKTDQFMVGLVFYELIMGLPLFKGESLDEITRQQNEFFNKKEARAAVIKSLPKELKQVFEQLFQIIPEHRFTNIKELAKQLAKINIKSNPDNDIAYESYMRCTIANKNFMDDFYHQFFKDFADKKYLERFENRRVNETTKRKLLKMLLQVIDFQPNMNMTEVERLKQFKGHKGLTHEDYQNFLMTMRNVIKANDRLWQSDPSIEKAWTRLMAKSLEALQ
jgi:serine/threonine protein kinase